MPLNSAAYLTSLGWEGSGNALRKGGMVKPLAIPQKRTLAGVGKDRDEAFPFWDHVFNAAASSIKIKIHNDDSDQSDVEPEQTNALELSFSRTATGIISNRRPVATTPSSTLAGPRQTDNTAYATNKPRLSLLAEAKRQAASARLYATFYRGLVIAPLDEELKSVNRVVEMKAQKTDTAINHDTLIDPDTHNPYKEEKSSKNKSTLRDNIQKESGIRPAEIPGKLENQKHSIHKIRSKTKIEICSEENVIEESSKRSKKKRQRDLVAEEGELTKEKRRRMKDAGSEKDDDRGKRKKSKSKIKVPNGESS